MQTVIILDLMIVAFLNRTICPNQYKKVIYIMRDGREALLSYYHMARNMGTPVSLEDLYSGKIKLYDTKALHLIYCLKV